MPLTRADMAPVTTTPNASMTTLASPSRDGSALAVWRVTMQPGQTGPAHRVSADQVHVVLSGRLALDVEGETLVAQAGDGVHLPAGALRTVSAAGDAPVVALVSMPAGGRVSMPDGTDRGVIPWAV